MVRSRILWRAPAPTQARGIGRGGERKDDARGSEEAERLGGRHAQEGAPKKSCFTATYPGAEWKEVQCVPVPNIPFIPRYGSRPFIVGNTDDISAGAPLGTITQAFGHFENPVSVTSESGKIGNTGTAVNNAYTLQVNTNFMNSTACAGSPNPGCQDWEQWVYFNNGTAGSALIQYGLIKFHGGGPSSRSRLHRLTSIAFATTPPAACP